MRKPIALLMLVLLFLLAFSFLRVVSLAEVSTNDWPMIHGNLCRTGFLNASSSENLPYINLLWNCDLPFSGLYGICSSPVVSDLNGNGNLEIVVGDMDSVFCLSNTGTMLWNFSASNGTYFAPTIADLYSDGKKMVLVSSNDGMCYCLNGTNGNLIWSSAWLVGSYDGFIDPPTVADLNGDGKMEVVLAAMNVICFDTNGNELWNCSTRLPNGWGFCSQLAVADINNDGKPELVFNEGGIFCVLSGQGKLLMFNQGEGFPDVSDSSPVVADINQDGKLETLMSTLNGLGCYDSTGNLLWRSPLRSLSCPAVADMNNDGQMDIALLGSDYTTIYLLNKNGNQLWNFSAGHDPGENPTVSPVIADINGDGKKEIIAGPVDGMVYCLNSEGKELWNYYVGLAGIWYSAWSPALADVNGDGTLDIVTVSASDVFVFAPSGQPNALLTSITPNSVLIPLGNSSSFSSLVSGGLPPYTYQWYINGSPAPGANSEGWTFTPTSSGFYTVYLGTTDTDGNTALSNNSTVDVGAESNYVFLVSSNSTITGLTFDATQQMLSFTASGPTGTTGYAQVTLSKSAVIDPTKVKVLIDNTTVPFTLVSTDDLWLLTLNYTHSTHEVRIDLPATAQPQGGGGRMPYVN